MASAWALVALAMSPDFGPWQHGTLWTLAEITCPVAVLGKFVPIKVYMAIVINGATYALAGIVVELLRHSIHSIRATQPGRGV